MFISRRTLYNVMGDSDLGCLYARVKHMKKFVVKTTKSFTCPQKFRSQLFKKLPFHVPEYKRWQQANRKHKRFIATKNVFYQLVFQIMSVVPAKIKAVSLQKSFGNRLIGQTE